MERNADFGGYSPYDNITFNPNIANDAMYQDPMFNPMVQYEQAYMYYRYLSQQMDYKIKCKEYEKMCAHSNDRSNRKIE